MVAPSSSPSLSSSSSSPSSSTSPSSLSPTSPSLTGALETFEWICLIELVMQFSVKYHFLSFQELLFLLTLVPSTAAKTEIAQDMEIKVICLELTLSAHTTSQAQYVSEPWSSWTNQCVVTYFGATNKGLQTTKYFWKRRQQSGIRSQYVKHMARVLATLRENLSVMFEIFFDGKSRIVFSLQPLTWTTCHWNSCSLISRWKVEALTHLKLSNRSSLQLCWSRICNPFLSASPSLTYFQCCCMQEIFTCPELITKHALRLSFHRVLNPPLSSQKMVHSAQL